MKLTTLLFAATLASASSAYAQTSAPAVVRRHSLEFGLGQSLNGSGDYVCLKSHLGYTRLLSRHFGVTGRLAMISGAESVYLGHDLSIPTSYHAVNVESEALYAPFGNTHRFVFAIGAGAYVGYSQQYGFDYAGFGRDTNNNLVFQYQPNNTQGMHIGYLASLNADYFVDYQQRWMLGVKLALQNDTYANILPGAQLKLTRRL